MNHTVRPITFTTIVLKFKQGEWCFCEFKLQQIMETEENRITNVKIL